MVGCRTAETILAWEVFPRLEKGMLCPADRGLFGDAMWRLAVGTGADPLWRLKKDARLECDQRLADGSYSSHTYASASDRRRKLGLNQQRHPFHPPWVATPVED